MVLVTAVVSSVLGLVCTFWDKSASGLQRISAIAVTSAMCDGIFASRFLSPVGWTALLLALAMLSGLHIRLSRPDIAHSLLALHRACALLAYAAILPLAMHPATALQSLTGDQHQNMPDATPAFSVVVPFLAVLVYTAFTVAMFVRLGRTIRRSYVSGVRMHGVPAQAGEASAMTLMLIAMIVR